MDVESARTRLYAMQGTLMQVTERESDAVVTNIGLSTLKSLLAAGLQFTPDDPVLEPVREFVEDPDSGDHVRAIDALIAVGQVLEALPPQPPPVMARTAQGF